jgi:hypothetical protein
VAGQTGARGTAVRVQLRVPPTGEWFEPGFTDAVVAVLTAAAKRAPALSVRHRRKIQTAITQLSDALTQETSP